MVNAEIRLIVFFAANDGEALYGRQYQDRELTVAQIKAPYCQLQTFEERKTTRPFRYDLNQIQLYSGS